jgi:hypothetical protein
LSAIQLSEFLEIQCTGELKANIGLWMKSIYLPDLRGHSS